VPPIIGKPLAVARLTLNVNGCKLGTVRRPRRARGALIVVKQSPRAGRRLRQGAHVAVVLKLRRR
jgi:beta-lactam-binding protein with PASTA domain